MKKYMTLLLKLTFAFGLLFWLVSSGKIDPTLILQLKNYPILVTATVVSMILIVVMTTFRYKLILSLKASRSIKFKELLTLQWVGLFFNAILPGSVTGDIIKIYYIKKQDESLSNKFLLSSILLDRVLGLLAIILLLGITSIVNYDTLSSLSSDLKTLLDINIFLFSCTIVGIVFIYFFSSIPSKLFGALYHKTNIGLITKLDSLWQELVESRKKLFLLLLISLVVQVSSVLIFWNLSLNFSDGEFLFKYAMTMIPLGFISVAIPIAPSGLGVGHTVFQKLFELVDINNGANLFNLYFVILLVVNLTGVIPYLIRRPKK